MFLREIRCVCDWWNGELCGDLVLGFPFEPCQRMSGNDVEDFAWAVKTEDMNNVTAFVQKLGVNVRDQNQRTPMHWAADYGQVSVIEFLCKQPQVDINAKDKFGITPLLAAVYENHEAAVKALLAHGADKTVKTPSGESIKEAAEKDSIKNLLCK